MYVAQLAYVPHAAASWHNDRDLHGEAVVITPLHSAMLDDRVFASHASFTTRTASVVVAQPGGRRLSYSTNRSLAIFVARSLPRALRPGDRITRSWDGAIFEVVSAHREGDTLCCELVAGKTRTH